MKNGEDDCPSFMSVRFLLMYIMLGLVQILDLEISLEPTALVPLDWFLDFEITTDEIVICLEMRYFLLINMTGAKYHIIFIYVLWPQFLIKVILIFIELYWVVLCFNAKNKNYKFNVGFSSLNVKNGFVFSFNIMKDA